MSRCSLLPFLAAAASLSSSLVLAEEAVQISPTPSDTSVIAAAHSANDARLSFLNAVVGAPKLDVAADNKFIFKSAKFGRGEKPKFLKAEGYAIELFPSKIGLPLTDTITTSFAAGRDYTLVPMGDLDTTAPINPLLVDIPGQFVAKINSHVIFVNASPDAPPLQLVMDDQDLGTSISAGSWLGPIVINEGKHRVEVFSGPTRVINEKVEKFKKGRTITLVVHGTFQTNDGTPLDLEAIEAKSR